MFSRSCLENLFNPSLHGCFWQGRDKAGWSAAIKRQKRESIRKQEEPWPWISGKVASWPSNKRCGVWSGRGSNRLARDHSGQLGRGWIHFVLWELLRTEHIKLLLTLAALVLSVRVSYSPAIAPPILKSPHLDTESVCFEFYCSFRLCRWIGKVWGALHVECNVLNE